MIRSGHPAILQGLKEQRSRRWVQKREGEVCSKQNINLRPDVLGFEKAYYKLTDLIIKSGERAQLLLLAQKPSGSNRLYMCAKHDNFLWFSWKPIPASICFYFVMEKSCSSTNRPLWGFGRQERCGITGDSENLPASGTQLCTNRQETLEKTFPLPVP